MDWGLLLIVAVIVIIVLVLVAAVAGRSRHHTSPVAPSRATVRCLRCHGTGWIHETGRTLEFGGDGFADRQAPAVPCGDCGGTGQAPLRKS